MTAIHQGMHLREAIRACGELGGSSRQIVGTGELLFTLPGRAKRVKVNCRKKCAPAILVSALRQLSKGRA